MSLHAQLSPKTLARLQTQQRNSTISSIVIAILAVLLIGIIMLFLILPRIDQFTPEIITYTPPGEDNKRVITHTPSRSMKRQPAAPSSPVAKAIAVNIASPISIPIPENVVDTPSLVFGGGDDFGSDSDARWGETGGGSDGFGSTTKLIGTITGHLYDFKQSPSREPISNYNVQDRDDFTNPVKRLHRSRYSDIALNRHYKTKQQLSIRYIAIPHSSANDGPRFFKAEKEIKPSGWIANYKGQVVAPKNGTFRLIGAADDYLSVTMDGKFRLIAAWPDIQDTLKVREANARKAPNTEGPFDKTPLTYGEWFDVRKGQAIDLGITIGERPGGRVGFILMIEEKGVKYRTTSSGKSILPPFTVGILSPEDKKTLNKFPDWKWETENVPVFHAR